MKEKSIQEVLRNHLKFEEQWYKENIAPIDENERLLNHKLNEELILLTKIERALGWIVVKGNFTPNQFKIISETLYEYLTPNLKKQKNE
jgi:hypothetical protein